MENIRLLTYTKLTQCSMRAPCCESVVASGSESFDTKLPPTGFVPVGGVTAIASAFPYSALLG